MTGNTKRRGLLAGLGAAMVIAVAACSAGTPAGTATPVANVQGATAAASATAVQSATDSPSMAPSASATAVVPAGPTGTAVPTSIDPCRLFTAEQASQLTGVSFGAGKESTTSGNARICTYGAQTFNVFNVEVAVAPDVATAQAARAAAEAEIQKKAPGLNITEVSGLGDNAATAEMSAAIGGKTISGSGVYVLKGKIFFSLNDIAVGSPAAPSVDALKAAAQTIVGQLP